MNSSAYHLAHPMHITTIALTIPFETNMCPYRKPTRINTHTMSRMTAIDSSVRFVFLVLYLPFKVSQSGIVRSETFE